MRAFILDSFDLPPRLREDMPRPDLADDELLVRVHASSVNGVDVAIAGGMLKEMVEHAFPVTVGRDYAGVVEQAGERADRYAVGDEVFGFLLHANPAVHEGTWAEFVTVPQDNCVAEKPRSVSMAEAGAAPLAALTALAALDDLAPAEDETVLVIGAAGGVGSFFLPLAAQAGAHVIAPGLEEDKEYLSGLGAAEVLDRNAGVEEAVRERYPDGVEVILDVVSFTAQDSLLKEGGRLASSLGAAGEGPGRLNLMAQPAPENLRRLVGLLDSGNLPVHISDTYELAQAGEALQTFSSTHTQGKLGISVP
jgi:NADPH:quinone reductase-like Zn-dependent oxidoreductase